MYALKGTFAPKGFVYPVITVHQARERGISAGSLIATAMWNERRATGNDRPRRLRQAAQLRAVAAQLSAGNDNSIARVAA